MGKITVVPVQKSSQVEPVPRPIQRPEPAPLTPRDSGLMDKSVDIRTLLSLLGLVLLVSGSFLVGRYVFPAGVASDDVTLGAAAVVDTSQASETEEEMLAAPEDETEPASEPVLEESSEEVSEAVSEEPTPESTQEEAAEPASEEPAVPASVVTSYSNVQLSFTKVPSFKWYEEDSYGTISTIWYTIVNGESGIVKPVKFRIKMEGDAETDFRYVDVPGADSEIDPGETVSHGVDKSIAYRAEVTDPTNINIQMELLDSNNKVIALASQEFNLKS